MPSLAEDIEDEIFVFDLDDDDLDTEDSLDDQEDSRDEDDSDDAPAMDVVDDHVDSEVSTDQVDPPNHHGDDLSSGEDDNAVPSDEASTSFGEHAAPTSTDPTPSAVENEEDDA